MTPPEKGFETPGQPPVPLPLSSAPSKPYTSFNMSSNISLPTSDSPKFINELNPLANSITQSSTVPPPSPLSQTNLNQSLTPHSLPIPPNPSSNPHSHPNTSHPNPSTPNSLVPPSTPNPSTPPSPNTLPKAKQSSSFGLMFKANMARIQVTESVSILNDKQIELGELRNKIEKVKGKNHFKTDISVDEKYAGLNDSDVYDPYCLSLVIGDPVIDVYCTVGTDSKVEILMYTLYKHW